MKQNNDLVIIDKVTMRKINALAIGSIFVFGIVVFTMTYSTIQTIKAMSDCTPLVSTSKNIQVKENVCLRLKLNKLKGAG